ncbi:malate/lactate/ureidoglycolate dehydrogenase [Noviherbaspirillum saxi]|uniref:Malate/lactate/ureidoglycolate dehydrogenase n=1 Tax=Noviherbaspirillum saxi TaxID=2320863 RepID=A0A3A3FGK5_9BURK|nr:malate/lactate/ureidoglycolate dehydrogenase [Noviherbaspirillum saxi]RJF92310.1 malate/lactate/ureidoglycolate dehydrogenase [Noviherbaspirillum saxi]
MDSAEHLPEVRIFSDALHRFVQAIWQAAGSEKTEATQVADHLVMANLSGHDSHGVGMIPRYLRSLCEGELRLNRHVEIARDAGAVLTLEGGLGFGQVVAREAMALGIERAKRLGICAVGLRNAHHIGRIGHWAEQCAAEGLVSVHFVNVAGDPLVAPYGGIDARIGTNPFCAAFPRRGKDPIVLDFATSRIAYGKTRVAYNRQQPVPAGCVIDHSGSATTDPGVMHESPRGSLLPFGEYKGYGLAAMCEIFAGALSGGFTTHADTRVQSSAIINCMLSIIVSPAAFDAATAEAEADAFVAWVKESPRQAGTDEIYVPGEPEAARRRERSANGIPVDVTTWAQLCEAARGLGVAVPAVKEGAA